MAGTYEVDRHGNETVTFSDREWDIMLSDPAFGYVCGNGHRLADADRRYGACFACEAEAERHAQEEEAAYDALLAEAMTCGICDAPGEVVAHPIFINADIVRCRQHRND